MILFGLKSLFINVPLEKTICIVLRRIYTKYELKTSLNQKEMTCFVSRMFISPVTDKVVFWLGDIFMIELAMPLIPNLSKINFWRWYVDGTICFIKIRLIEYITSVLNGFKKNHSIYQWTWK